MFLLDMRHHDIKNVPLGVWDQSRSPESRALLDAFVPQLLILPISRITG